MKGTYLLIALLFTVIGCREIPGELTVQNPMDLEYKGEVKMQLQPGPYYSKIKINQNRRSTKITLDVEDQNGAEQRLKFKTRDRIDIPTNGDFEITPRQSRLNVTLTGEVETTEEYVDRYRDREQCWYDEPVKRCYTSGNPPRTVCRWEMERRSGWKDVDFDLYRIHQVISLEIFDITLEMVGEFNGDDTWNRKVIRYESRCDRF
ncbi:MAG: hypothetical protein CL677_08865 [Bdellovibrionaceae bacterium]|nr:hypothetical protein [Pseudobdellovibrionaceae bacterium]|tara:strand:+ start:31522 stop:32136 length:615 start_codon:yes stop_codon:yes gene_type:complete